MPKNSVHAYIALGILTTLIIGTDILYVYSPVMEARKTRTTKAEETRPVPYPYPGSHVVVFLDKMRIEIKNGTTTLESMNILSKGKPGSYYETIGGAYGNDYKIRNHFSSIGQVYLPFSVHVFGNFFIHGIPYYPDGEKVSSAYSGGCIRLADEDAERIYDFVSNGMPIIVVQQDVNEFSPTATSTDVFASMEMTRYMATIVSLEVLKQDEKIQGEDGALTTRRKLIPRLLNEKDDAVIEQIAQALGNETFVNYMNKKADALGLTNTVFEKVDGAGTTAPEDYARLMRYIADYKSYLVGVASTTSPLSQ